MKDPQRIVTIKRKLPFYHEQQEELRAWFEDASTAIGSYFERKGSSRVGSGMTIQEENLLMPYIISIPHGDPDFRKEVARYFWEINTVVPSIGVKLNIALHDDEKPLSADNLPVNIEDYVKYKHALGHPKTAESFPLANANPLKSFYIDDDKEKTAQKRARQDAVDEALQDYFTIRKNENKVNMMIALFGETYNHEKDDPIVVLKELAEKHPKRFHEMANDTDLQIKYDIHVLTSGGVLDLVNGKYLRMDTAETLGTLMQTVAWFKDKANSKEVAILKAAHQETAL